MAEVAEVEVKSAWASKINWTQIVGFLVTLGAGFGLDLPKDQLLDIVVGVQGIVGVVTWIMRTWFTTTLTTSSASKL